MVRQSQQTEREQTVFELFLKAHPSFARQVESFDPAADDFPDITVNLKAGNSIGCELGEWLDRDQMGKSKRDEGFKNSLLEAIAPCGGMQPTNFEFVLLDTIRGVSFLESDASAFCREFGSLVADVERRWPQEPSWHYPLGYFADDFFDYPTIQKYITLAHFFPRNLNSPLVRAIEAATNGPEIQRLNEPGFAKELEAWKREFGELRSRAPTWVAVSDHDHAYSSKSVIEALRERLNDKLHHYGQMTRELILIVYYDQALLYNTPYSDRINFDTFADVAREASQFVHGMGVGKFPFKKVFLLKALWPEPEAFEIWPNLSKCS